MRYLISVIKDRRARSMVAASGFSIGLALLANGLKSYYGGATFDIEIYAGLLQLLGNAVVFAAYTRGLFSFTDWRARMVAFIGTLTPVMFATLTIWNVLLPHFLGS